MAAFGKGATEASEQGQQSPLEAEQVGDEAWLGVAGVSWLCLWM
jgi:hypothetical protein